MMWMPIGLRISFHFLYSYTKCMPQALLLFAR